MTTAIIGVGNIGGAVARHLIAGGGPVVVFAVWLDTIRELISEHARSLEGKVVVDPSNPIGFNESGQPIRTLPEGQSAGWRPPPVRPEWPARRPRPSEHRRRGRGIA